jgi:hypothetical protein
MAIYRVALLEIKLQFDTIQKLCHLDFNQLISSMKVSILVQLQQLISSVVLILEL